MATWNLTLRQLIEELEELEAEAPDAIPTMIGRDGKESLIGRVGHEAVVGGGHDYVVLRPGLEVV